MENINYHHPVLLYEAHQMRNLSGSKGVPQIHWVGIEGEYNILVMELLGPNLYDLFKECGGRFSHKTCILIAIQLLEIMNSFNNKGYIHRDIKPQNLCMGSGKRGDMLYVIDYHLARKIDDISLNLIDNPQSLKLSDKYVGDKNFISKWVHAGVTTIGSRRDDLAAIYNTFYMFMKGNMPWYQHLRRKEEDERIIFIIKRDITERVMCSAIP